MIEMGINVNLIFRVYQLIPFYLLYMVPRYSRESEFIHNTVPYRAVFRYPIKFLSRSRSLCARRTVISASKFSVFPLKK